MVGWHDLDASVVGMSQNMLKRLRRESMPPHYPLRNIRQSSASDAPT
jgi:hypothetical protein